MYFEAVKAPFLGQHARRFGIGFRLAGGERAFWRFSCAVGLARFYAPGQVAASGVVHAHAVTAGSTEHLVDRQAGGLACQVPQGDVDAADGAHFDRAADIAAPVHGLPQRLDVCRVLADEERFQATDLGDDALRVALQVWFAQAGQFGVGVDAQPYPTGGHAEDLEFGDFHRSDSFRRWPRRESRTHGEPGEEMHRCHIIALTVNVAVLSSLS